MGVTNFRMGLLRKYAAWCGERIQLQRKIAEIEAEYKTLSEKRDRVSRLEDLVEASITIMGELDSEWKPSDTPPKLPKAQRIPFEHGATTVAAFSISFSASSLVGASPISRTIGSVPEARTCNHALRVGQ